MSKDIFEPIKTNNQTINTEYLATESELETDARTWKNQSTFLALLGLLLLIAIICYVNHQTTERFTVTMEKHYNITFPSKLYTKSQKLKWFCSNYKLSPAGCETVSSIESKIQKGNLMKPNGFDIQKFNKRMEETKNTINCTKYAAAEEVEEEIKSRRRLHIELAALTQQEFDDYLPDRLVLPPPTLKIGGVSPLFPLCE